jgi:hypothetical protein
MLGLNVQRCVVKYGNNKTRMKRNSSLYRNDLRVRPKSHLLQYQPEQ